MTYYALCITICLASLLIAFAASAAVAAASEWVVARAMGGWPVEIRARAVFACRVAPALIALGVTFSFVLPSFLRWEPVRTTEPVGARLVCLAGMTLLLAAIALSRVLRAVFAGRRMTRQWKREGTRRPDFAGIPVYELPNAGGLVTTTGIVANQIFISSNVIASLTPAELEAALSHERAHIASTDNLKQLLLRALRLPWSAGDRVWTAGGEVAADLRALQDGAQAVELASALLKVVRLRNTIDINACAAASCLIPRGQESALADRVRRLIEMVSGDTPQPPRRVARRGTRFAVVAVIIAIALAFATQPDVLQVTHELIEKLV